MALYVDGFVMAVPKTKVDAYCKLAKKAGKLWMEHGALHYVECIGDDVLKGKVTSFPMAVKLKKNETVWFSWITYKSRKHRDAVNKKVMADPRLAAMCKPEDTPFDMQRMIWSGFKAMVEHKKK